MHIDSSHVRFFVCLYASIIALSAAPGDLSPQDFDDRCLRLSASDLYPGFQYSGEDARQFLAELQHRLCRRVAADSMTRSEARQVWIATSAMVGLCNGSDLRPQWARDATSPEQAASVYFCTQVHRADTRHTVAALTREWDRLNSELFCEWVRKLNAEPPVPVRTLPSSSRLRAVGDSLCASTRTGATTVEEARNRMIIEVGVAQSGFSRELAREMVQDVGRRARRLPGLIAAFVAFLASVAGLLLVLRKLSAPME